MKRLPMFRIITVLVVLSIGPVLPGCVSVPGGLSRGIVQAISNQDDPATVRDGAPAYLLMIDGFVEDDPANQRMLIAGARLYGSYAAVFAGDQERARRLATRARSYGRRALCGDYPRLCEGEHRPHEEFVRLLGTVGDNDIDALYAYGLTWAIWIQTHADDWNALADLSRAEAVMMRVVELDPAHDTGQPYLYLGIMNSYLPPALGGNPETGRAYFEKAIDLSHGANLSAKVEMAGRYARLVFDRPLHDRLLNEVIESDPVAPGMTLSNTLARQRARGLLDSSDEYFAE